MAPGDACHECRKDQERSPGCRGGRSRRSRCRRRRRGGGEEEDRISSLPDDLLLQILARLRCARAAALTGLLARRWRGLWTRLPELTFHNTTPDRLHAALAQAASPVLSLLEIRVSSHPASASGWAAPLLRTAAALAPKKLNIVIEFNHWHPCPFLEDAFQLPCFDRTISICLEYWHFFDIRLALPPAGRFQALESLSLASCRIDLAALLPLCPHLRKLRICCSELDSLTVHSPLLEELDVRLEETVTRIDILTPLLKRLKFFGCCANRCCPMPSDDECILTYSAPVVEELSWEYETPASINWFEMDWLLDRLKLESLQPQHYPRDHILSLKVAIDDGSFIGMWTFEEAISSQIPVTRFSILKLDFISKGHVYGAMVLFVLGFCTFIQTLELKLSELEDEECTVNCACDQPNNWRSQNLSLTNLKKVDIQGFKGEDHEIDLLKVIFRSAAMLERVSVKLSSKVSLRDRCIGIQSILEARPSVECKIYHGSGACLIDIDA